MYNKYKQIFVYIFQQYMFHQQNNTSYILYKIKYIMAKFLLIKNLTMINQNLCGMRKIIQRILNNDLLHQKLPKY